MSTITSHFMKHQAFKDAIVIPEWKHNLLVGEHKNFCKSVYKNLVNTINEEKKTKMENYTLQYIDDYELSMFCYLKDILKNDYSFRRFNEQREEHIEYNKKLEVVKKEIEELM